MAGQTPKKMNVVQLTFIVTINMMGSGIIMLPTNMAKVGAISLLSWVVTALGSMAMAYGFAQAGIYNQRPGGLAAYAEDAYGKDGYFQTFFLYFLSLAIANVAVAVSALGYLAGFFPGLTPSPTATCVGVIALLWLTTVANFGGPKITGRIGSVTVWGVILPVGFMAFFGWFWFKDSTFAEAWNPEWLSIMQGMGSSISLTLWHFSASSRRRRTHQRSRTRNATCRSRACSARLAPASSTCSRPPRSRVSCRTRTSPHRPARSVPRSRRCSTRRSVRSSWVSPRWRASARCSAGSSRSQP